MTNLADGNVLIALTVSDHVHHRAAVEWFGTTDDPLATCPITQGTLLRFLIREGLTSRKAAAALSQITSQPWHRFWSDEISYDSDLLSSVIGHRQVTDAYLVGLAGHFDGAVVTLDRGLAASHAARTILIPT